MSFITKLWKKEEVEDNHMAIVPFNYFSSLMLDIERRGVRNFPVATFDFNDPTQSNIQLNDYEILPETDEIDSYDVVNINQSEADEDLVNDNELEKGKKIFIAFDRKLLKSYPEKVHLFMGGSGGYYSYYMGVASVLQKHFKMDNVVYSGVSGGTIVNLILALGRDIEQTFNEWNLPLLQQVSKYKLGALFNWNSVALEFIRTKLPEDAWQKVKGRYYVFATEFQMFQKGKLRMLSDWENNDELTKAILCSSQIPLLLGGDIYTNYKGKKYVDGWFEYYPELNVHNQTLPSIKIYCNTWRPYKTSWLWCWTSEEWHRKIFSWGCEDALHNLNHFKQFLMPK